MFKEYLDKFNTLSGKVSNEELNKIAAEVISNLEKEADFIDDISSGNTGYDPLGSLVIDKSDYVSNAEENARYDGLKAGLVAGGLTTAAAAVLLRKQRINAYLAGKKKPNIKKVSSENSLELEKSANKQSFKEFKKIHEKGIATTGHVVKGTTFAGAAMATGYLSTLGRELAEKTGPVAKETVSGLTDTEPDESLKTAYSEEEVLQKFASCDTYAEKLAYFEQLAEDYPNDIDKIAGIIRTLGGFGAGIKSSFGAIGAKGRGAAIANTNKLALQSQGLKVRPNMKGYKEKDFGLNAPLDYTNPDHHAVKSKLDAANATLGNYKQGLKDSNTSFTDHVKSRFSQGKTNFQQQYDANITTGMGAGPVTPTTHTPPAPKPNPKPAPTPPTPPPTTQGIGASIGEWAKAKPLAAAGTAAGAGFVASKALDNSKKNGGPTIYHY